MHNGNIRHRKWNKEWGWNGEGGVGGDGFAEKEWTETKKEYKQRERKNGKKIFDRR